MKKSRKRSDKTEQIRRDILDMGVKIWPDVTAREIARRLGMSHPNVSYHFGEELKDAVAAHAVETGNSRVIAQLIATKHKAIKRLTVLERQKHMDASL